MSRASLPVLDELLEWCSERESGSIRSFREAHDWLAGRRTTAAPRDAYLALRHLEELGHVEVDHHADKWAVAPSVVAAIEGSGGLAILLGARPRSLMRRLWSLERDPDPLVRELSCFVVPDRARSSGAAAPATVVLSNPQDEILERLCALLDIRFEHRVSERLSHVLPSIDASLGVGLVPARPPGFEASRMVLRERVEFHPVEDDAEPGAYEYVRYGPARYIFNDGEALYQADRRVVVYAELRRTGHDVLVYERRPGRMLVPATCPLPLLYSRCAVLRTGHLAAFVRRDPVMARERAVNVYENVPESLFLLICGLLGQSPAWA
jgi:hypothetical protein